VRDEITLSRSNQIKILSSQTSQTKTTTPLRFQHTYLRPLQLGVGLTIKEDVSPGGQAMQRQVQAHQDELVFDQPVRHSAAVFLEE
jgi:hypothetical protein